MTLVKDKNPQIKYKRTSLVLLFATFVVAGSSFGWIQISAGTRTKN